MKMVNKPVLPKTIAVILALILVLVGMPWGGVAASNGDTLVVDVWTDRGGRGANIAGGSYEVGEEVTIYWKANSDCLASIIISGPSTGYPGRLIDAVLDAGETYQLPLGEAEKTDVGRWTITIDASTEGVQRSSDSTSFTIAAAEPLTTLAVDIWTDKGGRGWNVPGGTYKVGEAINVHLGVTANCRATWTLNGPKGEDSGEQMMNAGTYELHLGPAKESDVGRWQMIFEASTDGQDASDSISFTIIAAEPETTPTPTPAPTPSEPEEKPTPKIDASSATELYALMALKMSEGALPVDLKLDANADGQVTREDASLILGWAVKGS